MMHPREESFRHYFRTPIAWAKKQKAAPGTPESGHLFCVFLLLEASIALVEPRLKNRFENPLV